MKGSPESFYFLVLLRDSWQNCIYLGYTTWFFKGVQCEDLIYMYCEMITTVRFSNRSITSHRYCFTFCVCDENAWIYSLSKFQVFNMVLITVFITLYIGPPEVTHHATETVCHLTSISPAPPPPNPWQPPFCSLVL